jgi:hypothetical protein
MGYLAPAWKKSRLRGSRFLSFAAGDNHETASERKGASDTAWRIRTNVLVRRFEPRRFRSLGVPGHDRLWPRS